MKNVRNRSVELDFLKVIGIIFVIVAHTVENDFVFQLRNFDVILLVIISSYLAINSILANENFDFKKYFIHRFIRLVFPVWIFLIVFFLSIFILQKILMINMPFTIKQIISSFLLFEGIGYVWIIRVYLITAFCLPIILKLDQRKKNTSIKKTFIIIVGIYILYEIIYFIFGDGNIVFRYFVFYIIPYGIVCNYVALFLYRIKNEKTILKIAIVFLFIFLLIGMVYFIEFGTFVTTNISKYPARMYYLSYGIGMSLLVYYTIKYTKVNVMLKKAYNPIILFVSTHTMWIYLWHILFIYILNFLNINVFHWSIKFIIVLFCSLFFTFIQSKLVRIIFKNNKMIIKIFDS